MDYKKIKLIITSITILVIIMSGCDRNLIIEENLKDQLKESKAEVEHLKQQIIKLNLENKNLSIKVGELSFQQPNGLKMEERRKALVEKEANLKIKADKLQKEELLIGAREKSIRSEEQKLLTEHKQFITTKQQELQDIGEAEEMRRNYKNLQKDKNDAENLANNWLIWISILGLIFFISIIIVIILFLRLREKGKQERNTFEMLKSINISNEDKKLLISSLGQFE